MNLDHLRYFQLLAQYEHYTKAARELNITQPSLSYAISSLEEKLGVVLFEKDGRNIVLTKPGKHFLDIVNSSLNKLDTGIKDMQMISSGSGIIQLGFLRTLGVFMVSNLAKSFLEENLERQIDFEFSTGVTWELLEGLWENKYDLVICSKSKDYEKIVDFIPISEQKLVLAVPENHSLAKYDSIDLKDTVKYPHIGFSRTSGLADIINSMFNKIGEYPNYKYLVEEDQVLAGLVAQEFGIGVIPEIDALNYLPVKSIEIKNPTYNRYFYLALLKDRHHPPVIENFIKFVQKYTKENNFLAY